MKELVNSFDAVRMSFLVSTLAEAGIEAVVFDARSPWPGAFPTRLMVAEDDMARARHIIAEAERGLDP